MIIQTFIPGRTEPISRPPPTLRKLPQIILVQEFTLVAHDTKAPDTMLADRIDFFFFSWMKGLWWRRDKVVGGGHGVAFWTRGGT
jgi:hypothetical protein